MTRGNMGWVALCCLALGAGACAHKEGTDVTPGNTESSTAAKPATSLQCTLSVPAQLKIGQPVEVTFKLSNSSTEAMYVLDWHTPLEGIKNNILEVSRDGGPELEYRGPMLKRAPPQADDYVTIAPGASVEAKIDAALTYDFSQPGTYRIAFRGPLMDVTTVKAETPHPQGESRPMPVECPAVETTLAP